MISMDLIVGRYVLILKNMGRQAIIFFMAQWDCLFFLLLVKKQEAIFSNFHSYTLRRCQLPVYCIQALPILLTGTGRMPIVKKHPRHGGQGEERKIHFMPGTWRWLLLPPFLWQRFMPTIIRSQR